jgi:hypothetical protein
MPFDLDTFTQTLKTHTFADASDLPQHPELKRLLNIAAQALAVEDRALWDALEAQSALRKEPLDNDRGLTYWVYETNLVYTIWKAWLHHAKVRWEAPRQEKEDTSRRRWIDLQVEADGVEYLIEAKWWQLTTEKANGLVFSDMDKLKNLAEKNEACLMLTFWSGAAGELAKDVEEAQTQIQARKKDAKPEWDMAYIAAFTADSLYSQKRNDAGYFMLAVWKQNS